MTFVKFENGVLASALKNANNIAPKKGSAFDKAAGIIIECRNLDQGNRVVVVKSTNLDVYYMEYIEALEGSGPDVTWRLPSSMLTSVVTALPLASGKTLTLDDSNKMLELKSGRLKSKFNIMVTDYYPMWYAFDPDEMTEVKKFSNVLSRIEWAASKAASDLPWSGVHFSGTHVVATDQHRLAALPLSLPGIDPFTIPSRVFGGLFGNTDEMSLGRSKNQLLLMADEFSQVRTTLLDLEYPKVHGIMDAQLTHTLKVDSQEFLEIINRTQIVAEGERYPKLQLFVGKEQIATYMENTEIGTIGDVIEIPGMATHPRLEMHFTPFNLIPAIENAQASEIVIHYNADGSGRFIRIDGSDGYQCWVVPRKKMEPSNV